MSDKPQFSLCLSHFLNLITEAQRDYQWNYDEVNRLDRLELDGLDYRGRAKVATQIKDCRQLRRASKDTVEVLEPLMEFINSDKGKNLLNLLREILGKTRRVEQYMENRSYRRKVLQEDET